VPRSSGRRWLKTDEFERKGAGQRVTWQVASRPVWLFSSGPLCTAATDGQGRDLREVAIPKEGAEFADAIKPQDHRVFFGALDHCRFSFTQRLLWALPAGRAPLIEGDFRDRADVDAWAGRVAQDQQQRYRNLTIVNLRGNVAPAP
jgi:hypothetical protein